MNTSSPQIEHLKRMLQIEEKRAELQKQLGALDAQLDSLKRQLLGGAPAPAVKPVASKPASKPAAKPAKPASSAKPAPAAKPAAAPAPKKGKGNARGQLVARIIAALKTAGPGGATIKGLSDKFRMPYRNVQVWFATTGKKNPSIKKIAPATYRFVG